MTTDPNTRSKGHAGNGGLQADSLGDIFPYIIARHATTGRPDHFRVIFPDGLEAAGRFDSYQEALRASRVPRSFESDHGVRWAAACSGIPIQTLRAAAVRHA